MAYTSGMLNKRVAIIRRTTGQDGEFGKNSAGRQYEYAGTVRAAEDFNRGTKTLREGAIDAYDRVMFRMRWNNIIDRQCMLVWEDRTFQIESFNSDKYHNSIQITAVEVPGKNMASLVPELAYTLQDTDEQSLLDVQSVQLMAGRGV